VEHNFVPVEGGVVGVGAGPELFWKMGEEERGEEKRDLD
jgi:hypothetical protein